MPSRPTKRCGTSRPGAPNNACNEDWKYFVHWCAQHGVKQQLAASPATIVLYIAALADRGLKMSSIERYCISIGIKHQERGLPSPTKTEDVRKALKAYRRTLG